MYGVVMHFLLFYALLLLSCLFVSLVKNLKSQRKAFFIYHDLGFLLEFIYNGLISGFFYKFGYLTIITRADIIVLLLYKIFAEETILKRSGTDPCLFLIIAQN
ncbi:hypothetical protein ACJX0J_035905 [Zea mays]